MVLDSSAIVAIHLREPGHERLIDRIDAAITAFIRFGRGRHPAALNFGDCMSYAVASVAGMPLLFTGEDFRRTDIAPARSV